MKKKFVRSEWDNTMGGKKVIGTMNYADLLVPSKTLLDHLQSIEDRLGDLEIGRYADASVAGQSRLSRKIDEMKDHMKQLQSCIDTTNGNTFVLDQHITDMKEKINIAQTGIDAIEKRLPSCNRDRYHTPPFVRRYPGPLSIDQKKHICSAIEKFVRDFLPRDGSFTPIEDFKEELKSMICDTKVGEFLPDDN